MKIHKTEITALIVVGLLIILGAWVLFTSSPSEWGGGASPEQQVATSTQEEATAPAAAPVKKAATKSSSFQTEVPEPATVAGYNSAAYLIGLKQSLECTANISTLYVKKTGMVYVEDGKMRADLSGYINGVLTKTHMIDDSKNLYVWTEGATKGLVLSAVSSASGSAIASHGGIDLTTPMTFSCRPWTPDLSFFEAPTAVTFSNNL